MKIKKLACITMACVMAISCLAVSAFAAESEQEMSITGEKNVFMVDKAASMGSEMTDNVGAKNVFTADGAAASGSEMTGNIDDLLPSDWDAMPLAKGELGSGQGYAYGSVTISAGQKLTISGTYPPTDATMQVGYVNSSGTVTYVTFTGGSGSHTFTVSKSGTYQIYLYNPSSYDLEFNVSYILT